MDRSYRLVIVALALSSACAQQGRARDTAGGASIGSIGGADSADGGAAASDDGIGEVGGASDGADDGAAADADDGGGQKFDVYGGDSGGASMGDDSGQGCKKVDLLFVIDNSGSMADEQQNLVASFPQFIAGMRDKLADTSGYNVGVISSDAYLGDLTCFPPQDGMLITRTLGADASNSICDPFASGLRFMTEADALEIKFACTAQIGTAGDGNERPMHALSAALAPALNSPGACNEGFLRDDALLVVVIITDEEDDHETDGCMQDPQPGSPGDPPGWFAAVTAAKGGDETKVVVLSLVGPREGTMCPALDKCTGGIDGAEVANRVIDFTEMFTYGFVGPICQPYGPFFVEAIDVIESACDEFEPPG